MSDNLLALAQQALGTDFSSLAGQFLGESESATQSAMRGLLPAVLGMVAQKGATAQGASSLLAQLGNSGLDANLLGNVAGMLGGGNASMQSLLKLGSETLVPALFGDKAGPLVSSLSSAAGLKTSSATNLIAMVVPMIFAFLKKYVGEKKLDAGGLASLLGNQGSFLANALDSRITGALGFASPAAFLGSLGSVGDTAKRAGAAVAAGAGSAATAAAGTAAAATVAGKSAFMRWLPWIIGAAVLLFLWNTFTGKSAPPPAPAPKASAPAATPAAAPASVSLPAKVYFDTGSATVGAAGAATIAAAAEAIRKDSLKVALTGYTDKTGDVAKNEELAKQRATAVRDALKAAGAPEASITLQPPVFVEIGAGGNDAEARRVEIVKQ